MIETGGSMLKVTTVFHTIDDVAPGQPVCILQRESLSAFPRKSKLIVFGDLSNLDANNWSISISDAVRVPLYRYRTCEASAPALIAAAMSMAALATGHLVSVFGESLRGIVYVVGDVVRTSIQEYGYCFYLGGFACVE